MRGKMCVLMAGLAMIGILQFTGCAPIQITVPVPLGSNGTFDVEAGVPTQKSFTQQNFDTGGITLGSGSLKIDPTAVTVIPSGTTGKGTENLQTTQTLTATAWIDDFENVDTVCGSADDYGPFQVVLDENYNVVSISPNSITLSQNTLRLFNLGRFSFCIQVNSPVTGTVEIGQLTLSIGL